ncbi:MAG: prolyl aminopeptidase [Pseudomonadota bacterium]
MTVFPPITPNDHGVIPLDHGHSLHWQEAGCADGRPILILHGGPGGSIRPYYRQLVDPEAFRMILYDQRGCGRSTCEDPLLANDTERLVDDIERLREHLAIDRWCVLGGSWGSTLALAYAQSQPSAVSGLIVSGVFLGRHVDRDWWWRGARQVLPDAWAALNEVLPADERSDLRASYLRRVLDDDSSVYRPAGLALMLYEAHLLGPEPDIPLMRGMKESVDETVSMARVFCHYDRHHSFLSEGQLIERASYLQNIPGSIIAGRHDFCTPPAPAADLARVWPKADFQIVERAGHRWNDAGIATAIAESASRLDALLSARLS